MTEKDLVSKIKTLKGVRPDRNWVFKTKNEILGKDVFDWKILTIPAFLVVFLTGIFLYNKKISSPEISFSPEEIEDITTDLREIEVNVSEATASLEKVKEPEKVLKVKETVSTTIENGKKIVRGAKEMARAKDEKKGEVLAVISGVENALGKMEETYYQKEKELAKNLIEDLENRQLTEDQKEVFKEAKRYYDEGDFEQALIKAIEVSQIH